MAKMNQQLPNQRSDAETKDEKSTLTTEEFTNVEFEDLGKEVNTGYSKCLIIYSLFLELF